VTDVNPESCTIEQQVDRSISLMPAASDDAEALQTSRERGVIRDREIDLE